MQKTEKFPIASASACRIVSAVDGIVVSKPRPKNTTSRSRIGARERERVHRRIDHADVGAVGLGLQQALSRARHAHRVAEGGEDDLRMLGDRDAIVDASHRQHADRAAGAVHQLDLSWQHALDAVAEDRMGMAAADLHDVQRPSVGIV